MISYDEQMQLFKLIADRIEQDLDCYAFGGTAMLFYGYKENTKDIDLLFRTHELRQAFIQALEHMGFEESSPMKIYIPEKLRDKYRPLIYKKEDVRFDIFARKIFHTVLSPKMLEEEYAVHEFKGKKYTLRIHMLRTEHIVILKAVTERSRDFDDIRTIVEKNKHFEWQYFIEEVLWQYHHGDSWVLLDVKKMLKELKQYVFIEEKYLRQLYDAMGKKK